MLRTTACAVWGLLLTLLALITGCKTHTNTPPPKYFFSFMDSIFKTTKNPEASIWVVDSLYKAHPDAPVDCKFEFYGDGIYIYYFLKKDYNKAMLYADSQLALVRDNPGIKNYYKFFSDANISKADILFNNGDYDAAFGYLFDAKLAAEKSTDPCADFLLSYRLAMVMYKTNRFADALAYFKQAFEEPAGCGEDFGIFYKRQNILNYTALSYNQTGRHDSALFYCNKALQFITDNEKKYTNPKQHAKINIALGVIYGSMAQAYAHGNYKTAEGYYIKSIGMNRGAGYDSVNAMQNQLGLATLYYQNQNLPGIFNTLQTIKTGLDTLKNPHAHTEWAKLTWQYYNAISDRDKAYNWVLQYNSFKQAEDSTNKNLNKADVIGQIKTLDREYRIKLLIKDNNLKRVYLVATTLLCIMAAIIVLLLLRNWRRAKKDLAALTALHAQVQVKKDELQNALGELENRNNEKDRILGIVAHDLRNPIAGISAMVTITKDEDQYDKQLLEPVFKTIQDACDNSLALINEILELRVKGADIEHPENKTVDVNMVVANCVKMMQFRAKEKKQKLKLTAAATPETAMANPAKLWRVVSNLITNAVKFSPAGTLIQVTIQHIGNNVQIAVKDEGIGIPDSLKPNIFDAHTAAKRPGTNGEKPFGLGLSICKKIIEDFGGRIWFESEAGKGTIFYISLPGKNEA